ncbi:hypothetical protein ACFV2U_51080, partial [Streptomyces sp. NPDC059697]|uniref:hypothetical protein n=1 Tax=Streptomyces sp. NPDC059697 TaxID=3346912 RepID=UPI00368707FC
PAARRQPHPAPLGATTLRMAGANPGRKVEHDEAIQRYTDASVTAEELAGVLGRAYSAVGHLAYKEAPSGQEPAVRG